MRILANKIKGLNDVRTWFQVLLLTNNSEEPPRCSNFFKYFTRSFEILGLKHVIATCYKSRDVDLFTQKSCEKAVYQISDGTSYAYSYDDRLPNTNEALRVIESS